MTPNLYLCGAGNPEGVRLAIRINQIHRRWQRIVLVDDDPTKHGRQILGLEIAGPFEMLADADPTSSEAANLVARTTSKRRAAEQRIEQFSVPLISLVDPSVDVFGVEFGRDVTIYQGAIFSANAFVDDASVVFTNAVVGHGCRIGKYCVLAPGAVLNARVQLEDRVYVGTNASVYPDLTIGAGATIGANSAAMQDVPAGASVIGVPGEILHAEPDQAASPSAAKHGLAGVATYPAGLETQQHYEATITAAWQEVLHLSSVDVNANLFDIGGNSLLAVQLCQKISQATRSQLALTDIFRFTSVRKLAEHLAMQTNGSNTPTPRQDRSELRREIMARRFRGRHEM